MDLELMKLKRDYARIESAKLDQEIAIQEMLIKLEALKASIQVSEDTLSKLKERITNHV